VIAFFGSLKMWKFCHNGGAKMNGLKDLTNEVLIDGLACSADDPGASFIDYAIEIFERMEAVSGHRFENSDLVMIRRMLALAREVAKAGFDISERSAIGSRLWGEYSKLKNELLTRMTSKNAQ